MSTESSNSRRFGRYEVVAEIGRGAMGVVYQARDPQIDRTVAVKTVSLWGQDPEQEKEFRLRFTNEAQAAGRLHHPGIVSVFDVGEIPENQDPYIVLEYVAGESLSRLLSRQKKLPLDRALQLAHEVAEALDYAHAQGVVHRDIKPANILITEDGHAKIADFGIAKLNLAHFTLPGQLLGTPAYMAPEQLSGQSADGRSDLFSLGVILYVMVTGLSPFQGSSATTVCFKVANREPVAASALDMALPPDLDAVISHAIAKDPAERYQTGAEFAGDLALLAQQIKPASTTTSIRAQTPGTGVLATRSSKAVAAHPAAAAAQIHKIFDYIRFKASVRDLVLGAATIVLLVIVAAQLKLFVTPPKPALTSEGAVAPVATPANDAPQIATIAAPVTPSSAAKRKSKSAHPSGQIVVPTSTLDLAVQHQFKEATLYVWVDNKLVLTSPLHGGAQKRLVLFNGVRGSESQTLKIPAGKHILRFRAVTADQTVDLSKSISAAFIGGNTQSLQLTFDKHNTAIHLNWQ